jgi:hypothetical protein
VLRVHVCVLPPMLDSQLKPFIGAVKSRLLLVPKLSPCFQNQEVCLHVWVLSCDLLCLVLCFALPVSGPICAFVDCDCYYIRQGRKEANRRISYRELTVF